MDPTSQNQVHDLFVEAVELSVDQRIKALDALCGDNAELRSAVESLLRAHNAAGDFLADPYIAPEQFIKTDAYPPGTHIDRYTLLQKIGSGGCGTVYLAEQDPPLRRRVALKVIRQEMATPQAVSHFDLERQALATMDHPHIAKVFDAGTTSSGTPYFVMELIAGKPIAEFCREFGIDIRSRLTIFTAVCKAVHHAHQKGVVHRDLKPGNILLAMRDGQPFPTVIDFGVAKALEQGEDVEGLSARFLGTPQYMSPEQASMQRVSVDWRSDVYSLGAVLYELLTDAPPFDARQFARATYTEICQVISKVEPPVPSERLTSQTRNLTHIQPKSAELRARAGTVRGDLDRIVAKAMDKQPENRHQSAEALGNDVECYLAGIPVKSRFDRVHGEFRWLAAFLLLLLVLTGGIILIAWRSGGGSVVVSSRATQPMFPAGVLTPGLSADLYNGTFDQFVMTRTDYEINFTWERGEPPVPGMRIPRYSIRWKGILVVPKSGASRFGIRADDGAQVYVDGQLVLSFDRPSQAMMDNDLSPGQHRLQIEYRNIQAQGCAILFWRLSGGEEEHVPASALFHIVNESTTRP
ncbi:MAG TPA: protein kinase [Tepidisphaeraceae bacterium]|nr:protein kinase [Tepidisphaeraceae bacterium]